MSNKRILVAAFGKFAAEEFLELLSAKRVARTWTKDQEQIFKFLAVGQGHGIIRAVAGSGKSSTLREGILRIPGAGIEVRTLHAAGYRLCPKGGKASESEGYWQAVRAIKACAHKAGNLPILILNEPNAKLARLVAFAAAWAKNTAPLFPGGEEGMEIFRQAIWRGVGQLALSLPECDEQALVHFLAGCSMYACLQVVKIAGAGKPYKMAFDDMLFLPLRLNSQGERFDLVMVDEAQDMCPAQILLARKFLAPQGRLIAVGDEQQALFGFRGADSKSLSRLQAEFPEAQELILGESFRCPQSVGEVARIYNPAFQVNAGNAQGEVFQAYPRADMRKMASTGDFILCRVNAPLVRECLEFLRQGIPAYIRGKDLLKDLELLVQGLSKSPAEEIAPIIERIEEWHATQSAMIAGRKWSPEAKEKAMELQEDKYQILMSIAGAAINAQDMLAKLQSLFMAKRNAIILGTIHGAKGLEADNVFILPEKWYKEGEEEDNIRYVACTRAKKRLYLVEFAIPLPGEEGSAQGEDPQTPTPPAHWAEGDRVGDLIGTGA